MSAVLDPTSAGPANASTELAMRRTGLSFQRTRLSADRTLMSVIRTSLSLIGFGFTIFQFFQRLQAADAIKGGAAPRRFGEVLVWLGIGMLIVGISYHVAFMVGLRKERLQLKAEGLINAESGYPVSMTLITAALLLGVGLMAVISMTFDVWPFG
jgi:putative membrane protein